MKAIYFILSFYFMALSIMSCHDKEDFSSKGNSSSISQSKDESPACQDESCPPLCHCSCCGTTFVLKADIQLAFNKKETILEPNSIVSTPKPIGISSSIWQPPRVV